MKNTSQSRSRATPLSRPGSYRPQLEILEGRFYPGDTVLGWTLLGSGVFGLARDSLPAEVDSRPYPAAGALDPSRFAILVKSGPARAPRGDEPQFGTEVKADSVNGNAVPFSAVASTDIRGGGRDGIIDPFADPLQNPFDKEAKPAARGPGSEQGEIGSPRGGAEAAPLAGAAGADSGTGTAAWAAPATPLEDSRLATVTAGLEAMALAAVSGSPAVAPVAISASAPVNAITRSSGGPGAPIEPFGNISPDPKDEIPLPLTPECGCQPDNSCVQCDSNDGQGASATTGQPVRGFDGMPVISSVDLGSSSLGFPWGQTRSWTGLNNASLNGNGWGVSQLPYLVVGGGTNSIPNFNNVMPGTTPDDRISVVAGGASAFTFVVPSSGPYTSYSPWGAEKIRLDWIPGPTPLLRLTDSQGNVTDFYDVFRDPSGRPVPHSLGIDLAHKYGRFKSYTPASGTSGVVATYDASGYLMTVMRSDLVTGDTEQFVYTYAPITNDLVTAAHGTPAQLVASVTLQRPDGAGGWQPVQRVEYTYYTGRLPDGAGGWRNDPNGRLGDLQLARVENPVMAADGSLMWQEIDTKYYRYYKLTGEGSVPSQGATNNAATTGGPSPIQPAFGFYDPNAPSDFDRLVFSGLKTVVEDQAFDRLAAALPDYLSASDAAIQPYVSHFFKYERWADHVGADGGTEFGSRYWNTHLDWYWRTGYRLGTRYRVTEEVAQGAGCSSCTGGQGTYKYEYAANYDVAGLGLNTIEYNSWRMKTTEYLPANNPNWGDHDRNVVYTDERGQPLLEVFVHVGGPSQAVTGMLNAAFSFNDASATITITAPNHGFNTGDAVAISGVLPQLYDGVFIVTRIDANTFSFALPSTYYGPGPDLRLGGDDRIRFPKPYINQTVDGTLINTTVTKVLGQWATYYQYDGQGRGVLKANPSAVKGYDDSKPDLLGSDAPGHYQYLYDNQGLIELTDYYDSTTATETTPGGVAGYYEDTKLQQGQLGTPVLQRSEQYFVHSAYSPTVDVTVASPAGTSAASPADQFTYVVPPTPAVTVTGLSPSSGSALGGYPVTLVGSGFTGATAVSFGGIPSSSVSVLSDTAIIATAPAHAAGTVDVRVTVSGTLTASPAARFTYAVLPAPAVTGLGPTSGSTLGGYSVTLLGSGFTGATAVSFGGAAAGFSVNSDGAIRAFAPAHAAGVVDVTVTTPGGTSVVSMADQFTYVVPPAPVVTALGPSFGSTLGGSYVLLTGSGFTEATVVSFGGTAAGFTVNSDGAINAVVPPRAAGVVDVTVTTPGGTSARSLADQFTYLAPPLPAVTSVGPSSDSTVGGSYVLLAGSGFTGPTAVSFGGTPSTSVSVLSDSAINARVPPHAAGVVDVTVTTSAGTSAVSAADQFTYVVPPAPVVTALGPSSGSTLGGSSVLLTGNGFIGATAVSFGGTAAGFSVNSDSVINILVPAHAAGVVDVTVTTPGGTSAVSATDQFTYVVPPAPAVTGLGPSSGSTLGGYAVSLVGSGFTGATAVSFGGTAVTFFMVNSDSWINAVAPAQSAGVVDVTVTTSAGTSATSAAGQFTYTESPPPPGAPAVTALGPSSGSTVGGYFVTLVGSGFTGATVVSFGGTAATFVTVISDGAIRAFAPAHAAGVVDVMVTTPAGMSPTSAADQFAYLVVPAPSVTGVGPATGSTQGGSYVTIIGSNFTEATAVSFGDTPAYFSILSDSVIGVYAPAHDPGVLDITVTTPGGTSAVSTADQFTYVLPPTPAVTGLGPSSGSTLGGFYVLLIGSGFTGTTAVSFGGTSSSTFSVLTDKAILAYAPTHGPGVLDITVTTPGGTSAVSAADQFTYLQPPAPVVTLLGPSSGSTVGGYHVTLVGSNFTAATAVFFGGTPSTSVSVLSDNVIVANVPAHDPGVLDITVITPSGTSAVSAADQFTYVLPPIPAVTALGPSSGSIVGGDTVTLLGSGFTGATGISFGSTAAFFTVNSDSAISARVPTQAAGVVDVTVTTPGGTSAVSAADRFTYVVPPAPALTGVGPATSFTPGGFYMMIIGSNFSGATAVSFGGTAASFTVNSDSAIRALVPAQVAGVVDITVTTPGGTSALSVADRFTYLAPPVPMVAGLGPPFGLSAGGSTVTIVGSGFTGATNVSFGGTTASFLFSSDNLISAVVPPHADGVVDVTITTSAGTSAMSAADQFTYVASPPPPGAPAVTGLGPSSGSTLGGYTVTVVGSNFTGATAVSFGGTAAASFNVISGSAISAVAPAQSVATVYPVATDTVYRNTDGTGGQTTSYSYTWYDNSTRMQSMTVSKPLIAAGQNGPGVADTESTFYDIDGRPIWRRDGDGFLTYTAYDQATGAVGKSIVDVDTTRTGDFQDLPAGWTTPPGGGLHLVTRYEVDRFGRTTTMTDPKGNTTYTVYNDPNHEVRTYVAWQAGTNMPTGPTQVTRGDRSHSPSYTETFTMSAPPHVNAAGRPDGTEPISNLQTLSRSFTSPGAQVIESDAYFNLNGLTYTTDPYLGSAGTNYYSTANSYDQRGWLDRTVTPTGTIMRTVHDGLGRVVSTWVGNNDTPASGYWSPDNNTAPSNMVEVSAMVYDDGGVGDSNLTQTTEFPGGAAPPRVMQNFYDWRDRLVASKAGVQASEMDGTHRPISYTEYDNLNQAMAQEQYDGDGVSITVTNGVPDKPPANLLRARSTTKYDDQGRVYQTNTYSVDQTNGTVSANSLTTNYFFDHRSNTIEQSDPGGLATKRRYDGVGRETIVYTTDGGSGTDWNAAITVSGDIVLKQMETGYDANGNSILTTDRQRFHDEMATGSLGDPNNGPHARVYYAASYYDAANRLVAEVNVGTNGGVGYARPATVPDRSDTVLVMSYRYEADAVQQVALTGSPTGGTFTLAFDGPPSAAIAYNATSADVQAALQNLSAIGAGNALVAGPAGGPWLIRFAGSLAGAAEPDLTSDGSGLTGGTAPSVSVGTTSGGGDAGRGQMTTDPRALVTKTDYDLLGRKVRTVENFVAFAPSSSADRTTAYTYDGSGHLLTLQAFLDASHFELTKYVYGVTTAMGSTINSNDILASTIYPDNGQPHTDSYTYDALGEATTKTDRNGSKHAFTYDMLGRQTVDAVTTLGAGVDGQIRRIETAYDTGGRPYLYTCYDDASGGNVVNQVEQVYNGLRQLITEYQSNSGVVVLGSTTRVQYAYTEIAGGAKHSRLVSMTYPSGRILHFGYNSGLDDTISRVSFLADDDGSGSTGTHLEEYSYLGPGTVVKRAHPEPSVDLTYIQPGGSGDAGDQYTGLDRFGRVVDQRWINTVDGSSTDQFQYTYDRDGNRLTRTNALKTAFNEQYGYDNLDQLTSFTRGTHTQSWSLDVLGNWSNFTNDGSTQTRTHNLQNQITNAGGNVLAYDNNGNTTTDDNGHLYVYDAWNRLVQVKDGGNPLAKYAYDAFGRRVIENSGTGRDLYYSAAWQVIEEQVAGVTQAQYVWSPVYVDAMIERDSNSKRLYVQQDANWNVTSLVDGTGKVQERYIYDPYGQPTVLASDWSARGSSLFSWIFLYQGGRLDNASGLYQFRNRDESPTLGRWLEPDPFGFSAGDMNLYRMLGNNSPRMTDPMGLGVGDWFEQKIAQALDSLKYQVQYQEEGKRDFKVLGKWKFGFKFGIQGRATLSSSSTSASLIAYGSLYASGVFQSPIPGVSFVVEPSGSVSGKLECCNQPIKNPRWQIHVGGWFCRGDVLATVGIKLGVRAGLDLEWGDFGAKAYAEGGIFIGGSWSLRRKGEFTLQVYGYIGYTVQVVSWSQKSEYRYGSSVAI